MLVPINESLNPAEMVVKKEYDSKLIWSKLIGRTFQGQLPIVKDKFANKVYFSSSDKFFVMDVNKREINNLDVLQWHLPSGMDITFDNAIGIVTLERQADIVIKWFLNVNIVSEFLTPGVGHYNDVKCLKNERKAIACTLEGKVVLIDLEHAQFSIIWSGQQSLHHINLTEDGSKIYITGDKILLEIDARTLSVKPINVPYSTWKFVIYGNYIYGVSGSEWYAGDSIFRVNLSKYQIEKLDVHGVHNLFVYKDNIYVCISANVANYLDIGILRWDVKKIDKVYQILSQYVYNYVVLNDEVLLNTFGRLYDRYSFIYSFTDTGRIKVYSDVDKPILVSNSVNDPLNVTQIGISETVIKASGDKIIRSEDIDIDQSLFDIFNKDQILGLLDGTTRESINYVRAGYGPWFMLWFKKPKKVKRVQLEMDPIPEDAFDKLTCYFYGSSTGDEQISALVNQCVGIITFDRQSFQEISGLEIDFPSRQIEHFYITIRNITIYYDDEIKDKTVKGHIVPPDFPITTSGYIKYEGVQIVNHKKCIILNNCRGRIKSVHAYIRTKRDPGEFVNLRISMRSQVDGQEIKEIVISYQAPSDIDNFYRYDIPLNIDWQYDTLVLVPKNSLEENAYIGYLENSNSDGHSGYSGNVYDITTDNYGALGTALLAVVVHSYDGLDVLQDKLNPVSFFIINQTCVTSNTWYQLPSNVSTRVKIKNRPTNLGYIFVAKTGNTASYYTLDIGETVEVFVTNTDAISVSSDVAGSVAEIIYH
ncbi:hypothetical protein [Caldisericum sp.]|uniref:hypothetical protein n=1 Tax=Caldisericum sp. TaxID=2499687 RepID=UPI003D10DC01